MDTLPALLSFSSAVRLTFCSFVRLQLTLKQQAKRERKVDVKAVAEQLEWEHAQLAIAAQRRQDERLWMRGEMREAQLLAVELERRRHTVARMAKGFFDKLSVLSAPEAMEVVFLAKREQLVECCVHQIQDHVGDPSEFERIQLMNAEKKRVLLALQQARLEQIEQHRSAASERRAEELRERTQVERDQDALDRRCHARDAARKQQALALGSRVAQQIRDNDDARASLSLAVHGAPSPLYRTPWWSDESAERLRGFERPGASVSAHHGPQAAPATPPVHGKKSCRWYD
ncbi:hypothetical protein PybrP1_006218 [[Pythium] brassicae (nom. inval.)]|nr:hypothetical protein PybrP1_006218 [[Pythium] brassicae (nom. inval.)]